MKKIIVFFVVLMVAKTSISQQVAPYPALTKPDYLRKSRHQRMVSGILLGGGFLCMTLGGSMGGKSASGFSNVAAITLLLSGAAATCSSVPLFIISFVTKSKGMKMSVSNQMIPQLQNGSFVNRTVPSLNLKISL
jgi:hypothetical protein